MVITNGYKQNENERLIDIVNLTQLEAEAKQIIPAGGFGYITSGSEDEFTLQANRKAFQHRQIVPRSLSNIEKPQTDTNVFGIDLKTPIIMAPAAAQGLAHVKGEADTAKGVAKAGALMTESTYSSASIADVAAGGGGAPQFFQLYMSKNWDFNRSILDEAKKGRC